MAGRPELADLYRLADQLERDRDLPLEALQRRDHDLAAQCTGPDDAGRLLRWLDTVAPARYDSGHGGAAALAWLVNLGALLLGFIVMAGFLLGSGRGLVNVFILLGVFVFLQLLMSVLSCITLLRIVTGNVPATLPAGPARWVALRSLPDARYLREAAYAMRLLFLRYGQAWGALVTLGALLAFVLVPAVSDFSFVWGSTFAVGEGFVQRLCDTLAAPWSGWLPAATVPPEVVASSRYHPALYAIDRAGIESMRGWWGFLFLCLLVYALLPRTLLWGAARALYPRLLRRALVSYPGADLVLNRLRRPLVSTHGQAEDAPASRAQGSAAAPLPDPDGRLLLLSWSDALGPEPPAAFEELLRVAPGNVVVLGRGDLRADRGRLQAVDAREFDHLLVAVKSWEPPVAELADLLAELGGIPRCTVYLLPLPGKPVPHRKVEDWRGFARELAFPAVDVRLLNRVTGS